jgi:hypothetical protein
VRRFMSGPSNQATTAGPHRRRAIPAAVRLLQVSARCRIVMILFLAVLGLDLASSGICCADAPSALNANSTISNDDSGSSGETTPHFDDDCFCCAHSIATTTYKPVCLDAFAFAILLTPPSSALADLPPPYHPPQARA